MAKSIRDAVEDLAMTICLCADSCTANAKEEALKALDGDSEARDRANRWRARSEAYMDTTKKLDELRIEIKKGSVA